MTTSTAATRRRRAYGLKLEKAANYIAVTVADLAESSDLEYLSEGELATLVRQTQALATISNNLTKIGTKLGGE